MIKIEAFTFNPFMENTYVLHNEEKKAIVIDPGCYEQHERNDLQEFIGDNNLNVEKLLNTHCHIDHVLGNAFIKEKYGVDLYIHEKDLMTLNAIPAYAGNYGFQQYQHSTPDKFMEEGDIIKLGKDKLEVLFVPGHAPGHVAFYCEAQHFIIGGDVLFQRSIGRTDLPGGNFDVLMESIHEKFFTLPDDVTVFCGHGEATTVGEEKAYNPFCAISE